MLYEVITELDVCGMIGVGSVYSLYKSGIITDDDVILIGVQVCLLELVRDVALLAQNEARSYLYAIGAVFIHPFADGNGRMGRLWQSLIRITSYNVCYTKLLRSEYDALPAGLFPLPAARNRSGHKQPQHYAPPAPRGAEQ